MLTEDEFQVLRILANPQVKCKSITHLDPGAGLSSQACHEAVRGIVAKKYAILKGGPPHPYDVCATDLGRQVANEYEEKLWGKVLVYMFRKLEEGEDPTTRSFPLEELGKVVGGDRTTARSIVSSTVKPGLLRIQYDDKGQPFFSMSEFGAEKARSLMPKKNAVLTEGEIAANEIAMRSGSQLKANMPVTSVAPVVISSTPFSDISDDERKRHLAASTMMRKHLREFNRSLKDDSDHEPAQSTPKPAISGFWNGFLAHPIPSGIIVNVFGGIIAAVSIGILCVIIFKRTGYNLVDPSSSNVPARTAPSSADGTQQSLPPAATNHATAPSSASVPASQLSPP